MKVRCSFPTNTMIKYIGIILISSGVFIYGKTKSHELTYAKNISLEILDLLNFIQRELTYGGVSKENGAKAFVYWNSTDMVSCQKYEGTVTFEISGVSGEVKLVDPWDGSVYEIGEGIMIQE